MMVIMMFNSRGTVGTGKLHKRLSNNNPLCSFVDKPLR